MPDQLRQFSDWLTDHARGSVNDEITLALAEVTRSVSEMGAKGSVVLEVKIEPAGSGSRSVATSCKVTAKPPVPSGEKSIFYVDEAGGMHRDDPFAEKLDLQEAPEPTGEVRTLDDATTDPKDIT